MMIYPAIVYDNRDGVFVSIKPKDFVTLLEKYYKKYKNMSKTIQAIEVDLKKKTRYK